MNCQLLQRPIFVLLLTATVVACQTAGYRVVSRQPVGGDYSVTPFGMQMGGDASGTCTATVHTKFFNEAGFLGVCGFILNAGENGCGDGYLGRKLTDAVFEGATLTINKDVISKAGFYTLRDFGTTENGAVPTCVRTDKAWREDYGYAKLGFKFAGFTQVSE